MSTGSRHTQAPVPPASADPAHVRYVLRLADTSLVLGQRLAQWIGHSPQLEEDLGLANLSLDLVGQAGCYSPTPGSSRAADAMRMRSPSSAMHPTT